MHKRAAMPCRTSALRDIAVDSRVHPCRHEAAALILHSLAPLVRRMPSILYAESAFSSANKVVLRQQQEANVPSTDDMIPTHGFASGLFGRRTRNLGSGGSRGVVATLGVVLGGGMAHGASAAYSVCRVYGLLLRSF